MGNTIKLQILDQQINQLNILLAKPKVIELLQNTQFLIQSNYIDINKQTVAEDDPYLNITLSFVHKRIKYLYKKFSYQQLVQFRDLVYNLYRSVDCQNQDQECVICFNNHIQIVLECCHGFCNDCTQQWIDSKQMKTCPICRFTIKHHDLAHSSYFLHSDKQIQQFIVQEIFAILNKL